MSFSFNDLNLGSIEVSNNSDALAPGRYYAEVVEAEEKTTRTGGAQIVVKLNDIKGGGTIRHFINVHVPSSQTATRIGREQLKALCVHGGHPNPDRPGEGGLQSLVGLKVGLRVVSETYQKDGEERTGSAVKAYFDPAEVGGTPANPASGEAPAKKEDLDDDIPF